MFGIKNLGWGGKDADRKDSQSKTSMKEIEENNTIMLLRLMLARNPGSRVRRRDISGDTKLQKRSGA